MAATGGNGGSRGEQPPLADYALIGDCHSAALVSRAGSIDWCCLPRFDSGSHFGRLLDWEHGGHWSIEVEGEETERDYLEGTLVLETSFASPGGKARTLDLFAWPREPEGPAILRLVEGLEGSVDFRIRFAPRFDYGEVAPWIRGEGGVFAAIGGDDGLLLRTDCELEPDGRHRLEGGGSVGAGERRAFLVAFRRPVELDSLDEFEPLSAEEAEAFLERTVGAWRKWFSCIGGDLGLDEADRAGVSRSALVLKALTFEPTGAIAAAATTSLPEARDLDGDRNWDYRYSWVRDSELSVRSLAELGCDADADAFRRFIERSAAGHAADLQTVFGVGGERRLGEQELDGLAGWRGSAPVRIGNGASSQSQLDVLGYLLDQSWRWHRRGNSPDEDYWHFIADLVEAAIERWPEPDQGIWEWRGEPRHFVHSKAMAWVAIDRGIRLVEDTGRRLPRRWHEARDEIRAAVETQGFDERTGTFVQAFGSDQVDAALLRLPAVEFLAWDDERMLGTVAAVRERLDCDGLLCRYQADDGMSPEGAFLPSSFWLVSCLARQGETREARARFERAVATAGQLGLFAEEYDPERGRMLGNLPQALSHLSHIEAALALRDCGG